MDGNSIGKAIVKGAYNPEAKNLALDLSEKCVEILLEDGVLKEVPVIKSVIAFYKTWQAVHDQLFLRKIAGFVSACPKFTESERKKFLEEDLQNPKATKQLGDALVLILDKLDDLEKPAMLAKLFTAYVRGHIDYPSFRRLAAGIGSAFVGDLRSICVEPLPPETNCDQFWASLEPSGFALTGGGRSRGNAIGTRTDISTLGRLFRKCMLEE
jgi:hypothetical protein